MDRPAAGHTAAIDATSALGTVGQWRYRRTVWHCIGASGPPLDSPGPGVPIGGSERGGHPRRHEYMHHMRARLNAVTSRRPLQMSNTPSALKREGSTTRWRKLRAYVIARDRGICHLCSQPGANSCDHIIPLARGGTDDLWNLAAAHLGCNSAKGTRLVGMQPGQQPRTSREW